jgi:hypothetical protein
VLCLSERSADARRSQSVVRPVCLGGRRDAAFPPLAASRSQGENPPLPWQHAPAFPFMGSWSGEGECGGANSPANGDSGHTGAPRHLDRPPHRLPTTERLDLSGGVSRGAQRAGGLSFARPSANREEDGGSTHRERAKQGSRREPRQDRAGGSRHRQVHQLPLSPARARGA